MANRNPIQFIRAVVSDHEALWRQRMPDMRKYKRAYETRFYEGSDYPEDQIRVETSDGYAYIEGYIASLFSKAPAVEVGADLKPAGNPKIVQNLCNRFLYDQHHVIEEASRLALIYPHAFFKMVPHKTESALDSVSLQAIAPWNIIVDREAPSWKAQRFVAHLYYLPVSEAKAKWGNKVWKPVAKEDYFQGTSELKNDEVPDEYLYVRIAEVYDLVNDVLYFWSPNWSGGDKLIEEMSIPLRQHDDSPSVPIIPLYYTYKADQPLEGMSSIARIYDQLMEKNIVRSFWANAIRRDSRQYLYKAGVIDEEVAAKVTSGIDGLMIPVEAEGSLEGLIVQVPVGQISGNHDRYLNQVEADLAKGSVMAPFTRGQATNTTATEAAALAQYSASEIGRMARVRDSAIENIAATYVRMVSVFVEEDDVRDVIIVDNQPEIVNAKKLEGKFRFEALDQANTPLATQTKKQNLIELIPLLGQLGVPKDAILKELVRLYELPVSFADAPKPEPVAAPPSPPTSPTVSTEADMVAPPVGPETLKDI